MAIGKKELTSQELEILKIIQDPILWGEATLNNPETGKAHEKLKLREYQKEILKSPSKRKVTRMGRRCLAPGTKVLMADGTWRSIEDIKVGEYVASRNNKNQLVRKKVILEHDNGVKDIYKILLSNGLSIDCTSNHPLLALERTDDGIHTKKVWKSIEDGLCKGTKVVVMKHYEKWGNIHNPSLGALLGYLLTDGYIAGNGQTPKFTNNNERMINEVAQLSKDLFDYDCRIRPKGNGYDIHITDGDKSTSNKLATVLDELGLLGLKSKNKTLPDISDCWDKETIMACINRMFSGDGGAYVHQNGKNRIATELMLCSTSYEMLDKVRLCLLKVGVVGNIGKEERPYKDDISILYKLRIADCTSIENFFANVGMIFGKEEACKQVLEAVNNKAKRRKTGSDQFQYVTIKSINHIGKSQTYDIGVEDTHNFVSNGIINHNTGKTTTMVVHIIWYAFTHKSSAQVIATPYENQIRLIFDMIKAFVANTPELQDSIASMKQSPNIIKLKNGSTISGFTAGTKSGSEGASLRGQKADWLYMDEVDYMTDKDFDAIFAIALEAPERIGVWISSTPTGRRGKFWMACTGAMPGWKEFYYPSMANPNWCVAMEAELRGTFSEDAYIHEVLAEFGEETIGVFRKEFIDRSRYEYYYIDHPETRSIKIMGVDWDKYKATPTLVIMEYHLATDKFKVITRVEIPRTEFTLDAAVIKIIEMNQTYDPQFIYVDRGYGEYQVETLHKYGLQHPETELHKKVIGIHFGGSKDIMDPFTKAVESKPLKVFMVNQLTLLFERNRIAISEYDEVIIRQLENYRQLKKTSNGMPKYTDEDEHAIDCMMLCILGFVEKFPDIASTISEVKYATQTFLMKVKAKNVLQEVLERDPDKKNYLEWDEPGNPPLHRVPVGSKPSDIKKARSFDWSNRGTNSNKEHKRKMW
jgi:intein/homing endonuclease